MAQTVEDIQENLLEQINLLATWEQAYNSRWTTYEGWAALWSECMNRKEGGFFGFAYSCKNNLGYTYTELTSKKNSSWSYWDSARSRVWEIKKEIDRLQEELGDFIDLTAEMSELTIQLSEDQATIDTQQKESALVVLKTYAVPIIIVVLVLFGVFMIRKKSKV